MVRPKLFASKPLLMTECRIFILEGLLTMLAGVVAFWAIANFPEEVKFLTEDERAWIIWRKQSDNSSVGEAEHVSWKCVLANDVCRDLADVFLFLPGILPMLFPTGKCGFLRRTTPL